MRYLVVRVDLTDLAARRIEAALNEQAADGWTLQGTVPLHDYAVLLILGRREVRSYADYADAQLRIRESRL